jgi:hypothetical protein
MDDDARITKPTGFSFVQAHKDWYKEIYDGGIEFTRGKLKSYAEFMVKDTAAMAALPGVVQTQIKGLADGSMLEEYCPDTERSGW